MDNLIYNEQAFIDEDSDFWKHARSWEKRLKLLHDILVRESSNPNLDWANVELELNKYAPIHPIGEKK
jgi:hypothetical protein